MVQRKRRKDWHHRVPDFKLVYCGQKKVKVTKNHRVKNKISETLIINDNDNSVIKLKSE
jgi:hypothetical protein